MHGGESWPKVTVNGVNHGRLEEDKFEVNIDGYIDY